MLSLNIAEILNKYNTVAVVGLSPKENRPSNQVARYLMAAGYQIVPVNPGQEEILGQKCYPDLVSIPLTVDIVDIFRKSEDVPPIVDDAIQIKAKVVWMQLGIMHEESAQKAAAAGLEVVMDRCIKIDHMHM